MHTQPHLIVAEHLTLVPQLADARLLPPSLQYSLRLRCVKIGDANEVDPLQLLLKDRQ